MQSIEGLRFISRRLYFRARVRAKALWTGERVAGNKFVRISFDEGPEVALRPNRTDALVYYDTFITGAHLPPNDLNNVRLILDCGSSIGLTMVDFARRFPQARVLGIEMDPSNYAICQENIRPYADRCQVIEGALWDDSDTVKYGGDQEWGYSVLHEGTRQANAVSMTSLLQRFGGQIVDYVKMDIEGAEERVLAHVDEWAGCVRCMKVEVHEPYSPEACMRRLSTAGFECELFPGHFSCVVARNRAIF
jgi:FkbM family methyltransferase